MEDINGENANSTQEVATSTNQHWTDTVPMEEAEASKVAVEEAEAFKVEVFKAEDPLVEDSKLEDHHLVKIIKITNNMTNIISIMIHQQLSTLISKAMLHPVTQPKLHPVDIGMEINIIITEMTRPKLLLKAFTAKRFIGPTAET